jgi:hypothetical protein
MFRGGSDARHFHFHSDIRIRICQRKNRERAGDTGQTHVPLLVLSVFELSEEGWCLVSGRPWDVRFTSFNFFLLIFHPGSVRGGEGLPAMARTKQEEPSSLAHAPDLICPQFLHGGMAPQHPTHHQPPPLPNPNNSPLLLSSALLIPFPIPFIHLPNAYTPHRD